MTRKTERIQVRFTPGQLERLEKDAEREHRTLSGLIRSRALRPSERTSYDAASTHTSGSNEREPNEEDTAPNAN